MTSTPVDVPFKKCMTTVYEAKKWHHIQFNITVDD